jgi:HNH endonuclease
MGAFSRKLVWRRARGICEYCLLPQSESLLPHELDHIRAKKHRGPTTMENTCVACAYCNSAKGPNAAGYDPVTGALVPLFNPREQYWGDHFFYLGPVLEGKTPEARATIEVLRINDEARIEHRRQLIAAGVFPPKARSPN